MLKSHIAREMEILKKTTPDSLLPPFQNAIEAIADVLSSQGHSGMSAGLVIPALAEGIKKLLMGQTLVPLTGEDSEWNVIDDELAQNNRDSRVFKNLTTGECHFNDAIVFDGDIGGSFTTGRLDHKGERMGSSQKIKAFPFEPKTFRVAVKAFRWTDETETQQSPDGNWWTYEIVDNETLKAALEYYKN